MPIGVLILSSLLHVCYSRRSGLHSDSKSHLAKLERNDAIRGVSISAESPRKQSRTLAQLLFSIRGAGRGFRTLGRRTHPHASAAVANPVRVESWEDLASHLPAEEAKENAVLTLYRDTNGWCPFCERILLSLNRKNIPYEEVLIDLRNKPKWYKDMIPTELVPAMKIHDSGDIVYESLDMIKYLDEHFPETEALMHPQDKVAAALERNDELMTAGFRFTYGSRNASLTDAEKADRRDKFMQALGDLDASLKSAGPFLVGKSMSAPDICLIPMMERYRYQLPLQADVNIYSDQWPNIKRWFDAMDADPTYSESVAGDEVSWTLVTSTFLKLFSRSADGDIDAETQGIIEKADAAAETLLEKVATSSQTSVVPRQKAAISAARKLIANHEAVLADACAGDKEPKSQNALKRLERSASEAVDHVLRNAAARLLGLEPTPVPGERALQAAQGARFVATRICAPRDMGAAAAATLRQALFLEESAALANI